MSKNKNAQPNNDHNDPFEVDMDMDEAVSVDDVKKVSTDPGSIPRYIREAEEKYPEMEGLTELYTRWKHAAECIHSMFMNSKHADERMSVSEVLEIVEGNHAADDEETFNLILRWSDALQRIANVKFGSYTCQFCGSKCSATDDVDLCSDCGVTCCWGCLEEIPNEEMPFGRRLCEECRLQEDALLEITGRKETSKKA